MTHIIIEVGIIVLLIYMPLAFGGGSPFSIVFLEAMSALLFLVWWIPLIVQRHPHTRQSYRKPQSSRSASRAYHLRLAVPPFWLAGVCFGGLILLQSLPLPGMIVRLLSPATYQLYAEAARVTGEARPAFLTLSVCPYVTELALYQLLAYAALFWVMINTLQPAQVKRLVAVIIGLGLLEAGFGFSQLSGHTLDVLVEVQGGGTLAYGTFANRNHFAGYLEMVILLSFGILLTCFGQRSSTSGRKLVRFLDEKYAKILLTFFLIFVLICAHLLSGSRGGIISFAGGAVCLCVLAYNRRLFRKWVSLMLIFVLLALVAVVIASPEQLLDRLNAFLRPGAEQSFLSRWEVWTDAFTIWRDFPCIGAGMGTFSHIFQAYQRFAAEEFFTHAENDYLQLLLETGLVGFVLMLWIAGRFIVDTLRAWKHRRSRWAIAITAGGLSAMCSLLIHSAFDFNLHLPANALLFTVIAALTYRTANTRTHTRRHEHS